MTQFLPRGAFGGHIQTLLERCSAAIYHGSRIPAVISIFSIALLAFAGCSRSGDSPHSGKGSLLSSAAEPVRISSGEDDSAEPAMTSGPDGTAYVVWVRHQ